MAYRMRGKIAVKLLSHPLTYIVIFNCHLVMWQLCDNIYGSFPPYVVLLFFLRRENISW